MGFENNRLLRFKKSSARLSAWPTRRPLFYPSVTLYRIKSLMVGATLRQRLDFGGLIVLPLARRVLFGDQKLHVITLFLGLQDLHFHLGVVQLAGDGLRTNPFVVTRVGQVRPDQCFFQAHFRRSRGASENIQSPRRKFEKL